MRKLFGLETELQVNNPYRTGPNNTLFEVHIFMEKLKINKNFEIYDSFVSLLYQKRNRIMVGKKDISTCSIYALKITRISTIFYRKIV